MQHITKETIHEFSGVFPSFWYESNQWWGNIKSFEVLYEMLEKLSEFHYEKILERSKNKIDFAGVDSLKRTENYFNEYGLYSEYCGEKSLKQYLEEHEIIIDDYE